MAIAVTGGPNGVERWSPGTQAVTTATFTAPAGSLLVAHGAVYRESSTTSATVSGGSLTWTLRSSRAFGGFDFYGYIGVWTAPVPTPQTLSVSISATGQFSASLKVWIVTGADVDAPVGATNSGQTTTRNATVNAYTATRDGSLGFCTVQDWGDIDGTLVSNDPGWIGTGNYVLALYKDSPAQAGQTVTFHMNISGGFGGSAEWHWAAAEILPAPEATLAARLVAVTSTAVHRAATW